MNDFSGYYNNFMPGLIRILDGIVGDTPQKINIKSKTIEVMGDILASVKDSPIFSS